MEKKQIQIKYKCEKGLDVALDKKIKKALKPAKWWASGFDFCSGWRDISFDVKKG